MALPYSNPEYRIDKASVDDYMTEQEKKQDELDAETGIGEALGAAWSLNTTNRLITEVSRTRYDADPDWNKSFDEIDVDTKNMPEEYRLGVYESQSEDEYQARLQEARDRLETMQKVSTLGTGGAIVASLGAEMLDPISLGVGLLTGGFGEIANAGRAYKSAVAAKTFLRGAAVNMATEAAIEGGIQAADPFGDYELAMYSVAGAGLMGAAFNTKAAIRASGAQQVFRREMREQALKRAERQGTLNPTEHPEMFEGGTRRVNKPAAEGEAPEVKTVDEVIAELRTKQVDPIVGGLLKVLDQTNSGMVYNSDTPLVRQLGSIFMESSVGGRRGQLQANENMIGYKTRTAGQYNRMLHTGLEENYQKWRLEQGMKPSSRINPLTSKDYMEFKRLVQIGRKGGQVDSPAVQAMVERTRKISKGLWDDMQKPAKDGENLPNAKAVYGADEMQALDNYAERSYDAGAINNHVRLHGEDATAARFAGALLDDDGVKLAAKAEFREVMQRADMSSSAVLSKFTEFKNQKGFKKWLDDIGFDTSAATRIAKALTKPMTENMKFSRKLVNIIRYSEGLPPIDFNHIIKNAALLNEDQFIIWAKNNLNFNEPQAREVTKLIKGSAGQKNEQGRMSSLKSRISMDDLDDELQDFLNNDVESLMTSSINRQTGHIAMARQGFASEFELDEAIKQAEKDALQFAGKDGLLTSRQKRELKVLRAAKDHLLGRATGDKDPTETMSTALRLSRKYNFSRLMNQMGFAQLAETGVLFGQIDAKNVLMHTPAMRKALKEALDDPEAADSLGQELFGIMGDWGAAPLMRAVTNAEDKAFRETSKTAVVENYLDAANAFTSKVSGFDLINQMQQTQALFGMSQQFLGQALGTSKLLTKNRLLELGLDDANLELVLEQFRKHSVHDGGKLRNLNLNSWDAEARRLFENGVSTWGRRIVQENGFAEGIHGVTDTSYGKALLQFRSFVTGATLRHAAHGIKHRDFIALRLALTSSFFGGIAYYTQTLINSAGRPDAEEYRKRRLGENYRSEIITKEVIAAAFQRSSSSGLIPAMADQVLDVLGQERMFDTRSSGQSSAFIDMNSSPTVSLVHSGYSAVKTGVDAVAGGTTTQREANNAARLLLLSNMVGWQAFQSRWIKELPQWEN